MPPKNPPRPKRPLCVIREFQIVDLDEPINERGDKPTFVGEDTGRSRRHIVWLRTANMFAIVKRGTTEMVKLTPQALERGCDLLAFVCPLSGGTRQATRAWLGFTPLFEQGTDQKVWYLDCKYARVAIDGMPQWTSEVVMRHEREKMFWVYAADGRAYYALQQPDINYAPFWDPVSLALQSRAGEAHPQLWRMADVGEDQPEFVSTWAWDLIRLEQGARAPGDPRSSKHWPLTREAVARYEEDPSAEFTIADEEDGLSDASSLSDCYTSDQRPLPTGHHWRLPGWEQRAPGNEPPPGEEPHQDVDTADTDAHGEQDHSPDLGLGPSNLRGPSNQPGPSSAAGSGFQLFTVPELPNRSQTHWQQQMSTTWTPEPF